MIRSAIRPQGGLKPRWLACCAPQRRIAKRQTFAKTSAGDEFPDWASDKQQRLAKIQQAMLREPTPRAGGVGRAPHRVPKRTAAQPKAAKAGPRRRHRRRLALSQVQLNSPIRKPHHDSKDASSGLIVIAQSAVYAALQSLSGTNGRIVNNEVMALCDLIRGHLRTISAANRSRPPDSALHRSQSRSARITLIDCYVAPDAPTPTACDGKIGLTADPNMMRQNIDDAASKHPTGL